MICRPVDSLEALLQDYLRRRDIKPNSAEQLRITAKLFSSWYATEFGFPFTLPCLTEATASEFLFHLRRVRGVEPTTANRKRSHLLTLWRHAKRRGLLPAPDAAEVIRFNEPMKIPRAWTQDELSRLLDAIRSYRTARPVPGWDQRHDRALALVIYDTAFRFSACLQLEFCNLRDDGAIIATAKTQKTFCDDGKWLGPDTMAAIKALPAATGRIFPWPYNKKAYWPRWKKILVAAGLSATNRDGPQKLRRTSASWMEAMSPGSAERQLGHKTAGLARKNYIDPLIVDSVRQKPCDILPRITNQQKELFER